jgi:hypothetical protein
MGAFKDEVNEYILLRIFLSLYVFMLFCIFLLLYLVDFILDLLVLTGVGVNVFECSPCAVVKESEL